MKTLLKRLLVFLFGSLLFLGCSGGIDTTPVENKIISVRLVNSQGQEKTEITSVSSGRLIATLKNSAGKPLSGEIVTFSTTLGYLRPETATAITDSNGEAAIALLAGSASGAGEAKAVFGEYSASMKFTVADVGDVNIALRLVKAEGNASGEETNKISAASPGRLEAVLSYGKDMPISGQTLIFTTTLGYIQPTSGTAVTDSSGKASVNLLAGLEPGEGQVTVKFGDYSVPLKFSVIAQEVSLSLYLIKRETYEAGSGEAGTWEMTNTVSKNSAECLVATLRYISGNPVPEKVIKFKTSLGSVLPFVGDTSPDDVQVGEDQSRECTALTDKNGHAAVWLLAGSEPGAGEATATFGEYPPATLGFTTAGNQNLYLSLILTDDAGNPLSEISNDISGWLTASLVYGAGKVPVVNEVIGFSTTLGTIQPEKSTALTDKDGKAKVRLIAGSKAGAGIATAKFGDYTASASFFSKGDGHITVSLQLLNEQSGKVTDEISADSPGRLTVTLKDAEGNPVPNGQIEFETDKGLATVQPLSAVTDANGQASAALFARTASGNDKVTARFGEDSASWDFKVLGNEAKLVLQMLDDAGETKDSLLTNTSVRVIATLLDANGAAIPNETVYFTASMGTLASSTALTDKEGKAEVLLSSGAIPGYGIIQARYGDYSATWSFRVVGTSEAMLSLELQNSEGKAINIIQADASGLLVATLTDINGKPMFNRVVRFSLSEKLGNIQPLSATALTDDKGQASVSLFAGSETGEDTATAIYESYSASWKFKVVGEESPVLSLKLTDDQGKDITEITAGGAARLSALLTSESGTPIPNKPVVFWTSSGAVSPDSAMTDSEGKASVLLIAGSSGIGEASASSEGRSASVSFKIQEPAGNVMSLRLTDDKGNEISELNAGATVRLIASLKSESGSPIPNELVKFTAKSGKVYPSEAVTDSEGKAAVLLTAGSVEGMYLAEASGGDCSASTAFKITVPEPEDIGISLKLSDDKGNDITELNTGASARLTALLTYESGTAIPNKTVSFTTDSGKIYPETALTDSEGKATVLLIVASAGEVGNASASSQGHKADVSFKITVKEPSLSLKLTDDKGNEIAELAAGASARLTAVLISESGTPMPNETVNFSTDSGRVYPYSSTTDGEGKASVLLIASQTSGLGSVEAKAGDRFASLSFRTVSQEGPGEMNLSLRLTDDEGKTISDIRTDSSARLEAVLKYEDGTPIPNKNIRFTVTLGKLYPENGTAVTNTEGVATVLLVTDSSEGVSTARAVSEDYISDTVSFLISSDRPAINLSLELTDTDAGNTTDTVSAESPGRVEVSLTDAKGKAIPNQVVTFDITPELGILYPADGKVLTDDNGKAAADILPGSNAGKAIVTARYGEYSASLNFTTLGDQPKLSLRLVNENGYIIHTVSADSPARL
ncbi:MAG: hypothetical protein BWK80_36615, partial [Desulfobacteraceae bacterium IS3]